MIDYLFEIKLFEQIINSLVRQNEKVEIEISFRPETPLELRPQTSRYYLDIISGPSYLFVVKASARVPKISISNYKLDFGPIFVMKNPLKKIINLEVINYESKAMTIETEFVKSSFLDVQLSPGEVLLPNVSLAGKFRSNNTQRKKIRADKSSRKMKNQMKLPRIKTIKNKKLMKNNQTNMLKQVKLEKIIIPIIFSPREVKKYKEKITFIVNGNHKLSIYMKGEGCRFMLDVESPEDNIIDFGSVTVGKESMRKFVLKNNSKTTVPVDFRVKDQLKTLRQMGIILTPDLFLDIAPKVSQIFYMKFRPTKRLTSIKTDLMYKFGEDDREVFKSVELIGSSQGFEIKIVEDTLSFGDVVVGSSLVKTLQVCNIGDINAHYKWDTVSCANNFLINPVKGILSSSEEFSFSVKFQPQQLSDCLFKAKLLVEGFPKGGSTVTLAGRGVNTESQSIKNIVFEANSRTVSHQDIIIKVKYFLLIFLLIFRMIATLTGKSNPISVLIPKKPKNTSMGSL